MSAIDERRKSAISRCCEQVCKYDAGSLSCGKKRRPKPPLVVPIDVSIWRFFSGTRGRATPGEVAGYGTDRCRVSAPNEALTREPTVNFPELADDVWSYCVGLVTGVIPADPPLAKIIRATLGGSLISSPHAGEIPARLT